MRVRTGAVSHGAAILGLAALLGWALWPVGAGSLPQNLDLLLQFGPNATFLRRELLAGRLPLWNPYVGTGMPFLADPGTAGWYPPTWLALLVFSPAAAIRLLLLGHVTWAAVGAYICARGTVRASVPGAFIAAAIYAGGPLATGALAGTLPAPLATAWLPWVVLAWHRCLTQPTRRRCVVVAALLAIQLAAGWPPASALTGLALAAMGGWRIGASLLAGNWRATREVTGAGLLVVALTALLSAVIVLPALEFVRQTHYQESRTLAEAAQADYLTVLSVFGAAGGRGAQESHQFYSSIAALGLAVVGVLAPTRRRASAIGLAVAIALAWGLGTGPRFPLFAVLYTWLPGFQVIHVPSRFALLVVFGLALLAARGVDRIASATWRSAILASAAPAIFGLLALGQLWWSDGYDPFRRLLTNVGRFAGGPYLTHAQEAHLLGFAVLTGGLWVLAAVLDRGLAPTLTLPRVLRRSGAGTLLSPSFPRQDFPLRLGEGPGVRAGSGANRYGRLIAPALALLLALDLAVWQGRERGEMVNPEDWLPPPSPTVDLRNPANRIAGYALHGDSHFLNAFPAYVQTALLPPNLAAVVGLRDAQAYGPLLLRRYTRYVAAANQTQPDTHWGLFEDYRSPLLDRLAVRWVLAAAPQWQLSDRRQRVAAVLPRDGRPVTLWQPADRPAGRILRLVTFLGESVAVTQGTPVVEVEVIGYPTASDAFGSNAGKRRHVALLRAGIDTAEWAYGRPDVQREVQHQQAPIFRRTRLLAVETGPVEVFEYVATITLPTTMRIEQVRARALTGDAIVHVQDLWLGDGYTRPHPPAPSPSPMERGSPDPLPCREAIRISHQNLADRPLSAAAHVPSSTWQEQRLARPSAFGGEGEAANLQVFERRTALPRARWVPAAQFVSDAAEAIAAVQAGGPEVREVVFLEGAGPHPLVPSPAQQDGEGTRGEAAAVRWRQDLPARVTLTVDAPAAGWLVLADAFYPGWQARLDDRGVPIYAADGLFRAVAVPAGEHTVSFIYRPRSLWLGAVLTMVGLALCGIRLRRIRPRPRALGQR